MNLCHTYMFIKIILKYKLQDILFINSFKSKILNLIYGNKMFFRTFLKGLGSLTIIKSLKI